MSIAPSHLTLSKAEIAKWANQLLTGQGVSLDPDRVVLALGSSGLTDEIVQGKGAAALGRAPKTRGAGNIPQMWHPMRGKMQELGNLPAYLHPVQVDETIRVLAGQPIKPYFGYERGLVRTGGPAPFVLGGFDPRLEYDHSYLRPIIADDPKATEELYQAVRKRIAGMTSGKYSYTVDEMRSVVDEIKPIRDRLLYELKVGGRVPIDADPVTINRVVRTAVVLNAVATIAGSSDLTSAGLNRRTFGGRIYGMGKGARGHPAAATDLMAANLILAAREAPMPGHQRATATHVAQNMLLPAAGFRAGRDPMRQPGMPNLPVMPMTMQQAEAIAKNVRELELFESQPAIRKAMAGLSDEDLLDRTEQAIEKRFGETRMKVIRDEMVQIARDSGRPWTDKSRALHLMRRARENVTEDDFLKIGEEITQVAAKAERAAPGVLREVRALRGGGINPNTLKAEVRKTASQLGLRVRNPVLVAAMAGMILMGLTMARGEQEAA
jgi:hypothetical protein